MTLIDELHMELIHAADFWMYDTKGVMLPGVPYRIGVPMAAVRAAAQRIIRSGRSREFLAEALVPEKVRAHEVLKTTGLVIALEKTFSLEERLQYARQYQPFITNWALCDLFAGSMKCLRKAPEDAFCFIRELIESDDLWRVRTGLVLLLTNFLDESTLPRALSLALDKNVLRWAGKAYYVSMGLAWALSIFYVADADLTRRTFLESAASGGIDPVTARRTAQKIRESLRVSRADAREFKENTESAIRRSRGF